MAFEYTEVTVPNWDHIERLKVNQLGAENWECFQVLEWGAGNIKYFFKREIPISINPRDILGHGNKDGGAMASPKKPELVS